MSQRAGKRSTDALALQLVPPIVWHAGASMAHAYVATLPTTSRRATTVSLLPSPPDSPPSLRPPPPADGFSQLSLKGMTVKVREYVPPDHTWGEKFPGKQSRTQQLSLFDAGFKRQLQWDEVAGGWVPRPGPMC